MSTRRGPPTEAHTPVPSVCISAVTADGADNTYAEAASLRNRELDT
jgi:hypothetical protein